ncbi:protein-L-isoaspartate O-methyltransferase [Deltaproteobacteria bacterium Smac51]|nr:protein-L-isoaspartate O-methyltransferase [Deltaproteobacteria bacterium Smac51]
MTDLPQKTGWNPDDYRIARRKMVELQLKKRGIRDARVLETMFRVPRHLFVDEAMAAQSYSDSPLPIGHGQTISQPYIVALMVEALNLKPSDKVLEIGSGSGYQTAILAALAGEVFGVERLEAIYQRGRENLQRLGSANIHLKLDDGTLGWPENSPYDAIVVAAGGPKVPQPLVDQLAPGGRLIVPVGPTEKSQQLTLVTKDPQGVISRTPLADCRFVALVGHHGW